MSGENVEIVRAGIERFNDTGHWDLNDSGPDFELDLSRSLGPQRGVFHGLAQADRSLENFLSDWESIRIEPHEFIEAGDDVVVPWTAHLVGRDGIEVQARTAWIWTLRAGMIVRVCLYQDKQEALNAAGLSE
jgi:ketosteroid isomerase-like protein